MAATSFADASRGSQVHRIRRIATAALDQYPIEVQRIRLLYHGHNTTFRVDATDGSRYAMRINVNSTSSEENLVAETAWLAAIAADTDLEVPRPQPTRDGQLWTKAWFDDLGRALPVVVMSWLSGRHRSPPSPEELRAIGRTLAVLHEHAAQWSMPAGGGFPSHADTFAEAERRIFETDGALDAEQRSVCEQAHERAQRSLDELWSTDQPRPIHSDIHPGNVLWNRTSMSIFDFDDVLIGVPVQDLAISTYYLRATSEATLDPMFEGYEAERPVPTFTDDQFESLVAGRNLLLLNELLGVVNADVRSWLDRYVANTIVKLRAFHDTGRYRHDVEGVVDLSW